jgi:hypothetical protein
MHLRNHNVNGFVVSKHHLPEAVAVLLILCSIAHAKEHFRSSAVA